MPWSNSRVRDVVDAKSRSDLPRCPVSFSVPSVLCLRCYRGLLFGCFDLGFWREGNCLGESYNFQICSLP